MDIKTQYNNNQSSRKNKLALLISLVIAITVALAALTYALFTLNKNESLTKELSSQKSLNQQLANQKSKSSQYN